MEQPPSAPVCQAGCLLEGIMLQKPLPCFVYQRGEQIVPRERVFLICHGPVGCLWGSGPEHSCLEILAPGECWESWECAAGECRVWALGEVGGHWIKRAQWLELLRDPVVEERFVSYIHKRQQRQHEWQLVLTRGSVRARVAWQLLDLAQRFGERNEQTQEIFVPIVLTQQQQAALCGTVRSQVWGTLREFEGKRWLVCGSQGFWVRDEGALRHQSHEGL